MSLFFVTPEQRRELACAAADRARTPAEAHVLARLDDEHGMHASAATWRAVADLTRALPEARPCPPGTPARR